MTASRAAYTRAGVDVAAGDRAVDLLRASVASTRRPEVLGWPRRVRRPPRAPVRLPRPVLVSATDGVGTKTEIAAAWAGSTPSGSTWWPCARTMSCATAPAAGVPGLPRGRAPGPGAGRGPGQRDRRGLRGGRCGADRRRDRRAPGPDGGGRLRPRRASASASSSATGSSTGRRPASATRSSASRRRGSTPTATRWCGRRSRSTASRSTCRTPRRSRAAWATRPPRPAGAEPGATAPPSATCS